MNRPLLLPISCLHCSLHLKLLEQCINLKEQVINDGILGPYEIVVDSKYAEVLNELYTKWTSGPNTTVHQRLLMLTHVVQVSVGVVKPADVLIRQYKVPHKV